MRVFLTNRVPIRIRMADWPVIAAEECIDTGPTGGAKRKWSIELRQRGLSSIIIARYEVNDEERSYAATLLERGDPVVAMFHTAAEADVGAKLVELCVRKLPPVDLFMSQADRTEG